MAAVFLKGNLSEGFEAIGPYNDIDQALGYNSSGEGWAMETKRPTEDRWENNHIQFARLLAEIRAIGLTEEQYAKLTESMSLDRMADLDDLLERAETEWQSIKEDV